MKKTILAMELSFFVVGVSKSKKISAKQNNKKDVDKVELKSYYLYIDNIYSERICIHSENCYTSIKANFYV